MTRSRYVCLGRDNCAGNYAFFSRNKLSTVLPGDRACKTSEKEFPERDAVMVKNVEKGTLVANEADGMTVQGTPTGI